MNLIEPCILGGAVVGAGIGAVLGFSSGPLWGLGGLVAGGILGGIAGPLVFILLGALFLVLVRGPGWTLRHLRGRGGPRQPPSPG